MTPNQFLLILKARKWLIASLFSLVVVVAAVGTLLMPKAYTASAAVMLDVRSPDPIAGMVLPGMSQPSYMGTQLDLIRSERVILGVIKNLKLDENLMLRQVWAKQTKEAPGTFQPWLAKLLLSGIVASPAKDSNVITISFRGQDPVFASTVANALVDSYIDTTLQLRVEPAKRYRSLFDEQVKQSRERLEAAQGRLSEYQRSHGITATDERIDIETARLAELSNQLVVIQSLRAESVSRQTQSAASPDRTTEVLNNPVVATLTSDMARLESKLKEYQATYGDAHPLVQQTRANIAELRARIANETGKVSASVGLNTRANLEREAEARAALERQRERVLSLKAQRDESSLMSKVVESAQEALNRVSVRRDQTGLESESNQTNVSVVQRASPPYEPSSPHVVTNIVLAAALGLVFAVGAALLLELWDRRLLSDEDVVGLLGVPLMGNMLSAPMGKANMASPSSPSFRALSTFGASKLPRLGDSTSPSGKANS
jgi:succinoglycan biosynthesis transport protein ExoP